MSDRPHFRLTALAVLGFFFAQWGAIQHAYSHRLTRSSVPEIAFPQGSSTYEYCSDCLGFSPLLAAAGAPTVAPISLPFSHSPALSVAPASQLTHRTYLAFRSRAPPVTR